jgi:RNA polymerase sigma-70 factor (ECF subfamily)
VIIEGLSEDTLIARAREGDRRAQEALVRLYEHRVFGLIMRLVRNQEDARDILQDTMVKALMSLHMYDTSHPFRSWLYRIATNKSLDFLRRRQVETRTFARNGTDVRLEDLADTATPQDEEISKRLDWETVERCMAKIEPRMRATLFLRYKDGLSYKEIAHVLSMPMGTVKVMLHRGRLELKRLVRKEVGA